MTAIQGSQRPAKASILGARGVKKPHPDGRRVEKTIPGKDAGIRNRAYYAKTPSAQGKTDYAA
jgi:hypothetical protein